MKSYLGLIPLSAKLRKRQNRMTILCIVLAVFLVTAVFSMADMAVRMETNNRLQKDGSWHLLLSEISQDTADKIAQQSNVEAFSPYEDLNGTIDQNYFVGGKQAAICGAEKDLARMLPGFTNEDYPLNDEVIVSANSKDSIGAHIGDTILLTLPNGKTKELKIIGFNQDTTEAAQYDSLVLFTNIETFESIREESGQEAELKYYLQFKKHTNLRKAAAALKEQYQLPNSSIAENTYIMALNLSSSNSYITGLYLVAAVLAGMVVLAGVFMIAASLNSNVLQRTSFYGMLRCLGAGKNQVMHLVRLEALSWCKTAVPVGIALGVLATWGLCLFLRFWVGDEFNALPLWEVSPAGMLCGAVLGIITVWAASSSPARKASRVSPMEAVSGNTASRTEKQVHAGLLLRKEKIENSLGISHAVSAKKNLILMTGSFALSIILFLCFSVLLGWVREALTPLKPYTPDITFFCDGEEGGFSQQLVSELKENPAVKNAYGRMYQNLPAVYQGIQGSIDLISYDDIQFQWAKEDLTQGKIPQKDAENGLYVLSVFDKSNSLAVGDVIQLEGAELTVAGVLDSSPFESNENPTIICSEAVFERLAQKNTYRVVDIQLSEDAADADVESIRSEFDRQLSMHFWFSDQRERNQMIHSTYWAFSLFVYAFLTVIALITIMNIVNSISLSAAARTKQYGIMRAIGMNETQILRMITAEAAAYGVMGLFMGFLIGLPLYRYLYSVMITNYFGTLCTVPWACIGVCLAITALSVCMAVYAPAKRICRMEIIQAINEL